MKNDDIRVRSSRPFKLKDKENRYFTIVVLKQLFGFQPERIIVEKVRSHNNTFVLHAVLTEEEVKKENEIIAKKVAEHAQKTAK